MDFETYFFKVEKILKGSLDSIPPPSTSVKIQIMVGKVCLRCKGKTLLGVANKILKKKSLLTSPSNAFFRSNKLEQSEFKLEKINGTSRKS